MEIAELVFQRGDKVLLQLRLDRAEVCIGSNPTNDVVVPDRSVPDVAALLIDLGAHRYRLRDLTEGSVLVNGMVPTSDEVDLTEGDAIALGPYALQLRVRRQDEKRHRFGRTSVLGHEERPSALARLGYRGKSFEVSSDRPFNIGGDDDNDLVVEDPFVSGFHCRITCKDGRWTIADLESTNGTLVNGLKVREAELPSPATIDIGQASLRFEIPAEEPETASSQESFHGMIGESRGMKKVFSLVGRLADAKEPVLIVGESGSGKELVARSLHDESSRKKKPFLAINCGALTHTLIESELFGHVRGTFTGATHDKAGAFEAANGGTLFLDEIGELPLDLQPKLLRVLESSTVRRVGDTKEIPVDTRIIAATHRNLDELVQDGEFREDLFHRLFVLSIRIPALAERPEDVVPLARHFLSEAPTPMSLDASAEKALAEYSWPGNIRELRNVIVRAILMTDGDVIGASDLEFTRDAFTARGRDARRSVRQHDEAERTKILEALEKANGNRSEAARILGVSKSTFHDRVKRYGIPAGYGQQG